MVVSPASLLITLWTFTDLGLRSSSPKASSRVHGPDADVDASPEALPGASQSLPSVLYLLAVVASFGFGSVTLYLIGEERFLGNLWLLIGGFMLGAAISLFGMFYLIRRWARRRASRSRNP